MANPGTTKYPAALDDFTNPGTATYEDATGYEHDLIESQQHDAIEAIQATLGTTAGTSIIAGWSAGDLACKTDGGTVNNAVIGTPTFSAGAIGFADLAASVKSQILSDAATDGGTTAATTLATMVGSGLSVVIPTGQTADVFLVANLSIYNTGANKYVESRIVWDTAGGSVNGPLSYAEGGASEYSPLIPMTYATAVTAGTYNAEIQWRVEAGTATVRYPYLYALVVIT